jgi:hypothetical protein
MALRHRGGDAGADGAPASLSPKIYRIRSRGFD